MGDGRRRKRKLSWCIVVCQSSHSLWVHVGAVFADTLVVLLFQRRVKYAKNHFYRRTEPLEQTQKAGGGGCTGWVWWTKGKEAASLLSLLYLLQTRSTDLTVSAPSGPAVVVVAVDDSRTVRGVCRACDRVRVTRRGHWERPSCPSTSTASSQLNSISLLFWHRLFTLAQGLQLDSQL